MEIGLTKKDSDPQDNTTSRRDFLFLAAGAAGTVGLCAAGLPFIKSMLPAADVIAQGVAEIDLKAIAPGSTKTILWRGKPIFIRHRTEEEIKNARAASLKALPDPQTDEERTRQDPKWLVVIGVCTHLGCIPTKRESMQTSPDNEGGWHCACHGSVYDTSGRIVSGPAPRNLEIPPYELVNDTILKIG